MANVEAVLADGRVVDIATATVAVDAGAAITLVPMIVRAYPA